jgi:uncharacterized protein YciW
MAKPITETRIAVIDVTRDRAVYTARVTPENTDAVAERAALRVAAIEAASRVARIDTFTHTVSA